MIGRFGYVGDGVSQLAGTFGTMCAFHRRTYAGAEHIAYLVY